MTLALAPSPDWEAGLTRDKHGKVRSTLANAITILGHDAAWLTRDTDGAPQHRIARDAFAERLCIVAPAPWHNHDAARGPAVGEVGTGSGERVRLAGPLPTCEEPQAWADTDDARLSSWFERRWSLDIPKGTANDAARVVAERWPVHPVRNYLARLQWDGVRRIDSWLVRYMGAASSPFALAAGQWWIVSAVARVMVPGCKADHVLILEGGQGKRKSTGLRTLAGEQWFADTPIEIGNKDAFLSMRGKLIIELAELDSLSRAESTRAKAFFSSPVDSYRPPYGHAAVAIPRQCVFAGTSNLGAYLRDETGGRRFWPVTCGEIDIAALRADRDQLWAEAREAYVGGAVWWPSTDGERDAAAEAAEARYSHDEWEELIAKWANPLRRTSSGVSVGDALTGALDVPKERWTRADQSRVASCLVRLGLVRVQRRVDGRREWRYVDPGAEPSATPVADPPPGYSPTLGF